MSTATLTEPRIVSVIVTDQAIVAHLADGRVVSVPLEWSWRLKDATPEQRMHWEIIGGGQGVHWPDVDEDISVEGMLRGVPAKRPSRTETRILLDASSLIDLEHGKPVSYDELDRLLRENHARLILTYTNVLEFAAPFGRTGDRVALRDRLQQVERLPVGYLREGAIKVAELKEAVKAFSKGIECAPIDPRGKRWDETLVLEGPSPMGLPLNQSLYDLVSMALAKGNVIRQAKELWGPKLARGYAQKRVDKQKAKWPDKEAFQAEVSGELACNSIPVAQKSLAAFAEWIYSNPTRCPGFRLAYEWHQEWMKDSTQPFKWNNIPDRAHVLALPYVDAITMDHNTADLCRRVITRWKKTFPAINYDERIFTSLKDLLAAKF